VSDGFKGEPVGLPRRGIALFNLSGDEMDNLLGTLPLCRTCIWRRLDRNGVSICRETRAVFTLVLCRLEEPVQRCNRFTAGPEAAAKARRNT
jgi:hypothetical protein